jgi:flagella basal body P-ring formation protein FlgA
MKVKIFFALVFFLLTSAVFADEQASVPLLSTLSQLAKEAVEKKINAPEGAKIQITPQSLDSRLSPPPCLPPILAELASDREIGRNNTVKISCNSPALDYPWQVYLSVRAEILFPVVVAKKVLSPGTVIFSDKMQIAYVEQYSLRGQYFSDVSKLSGIRVKRRVAKDAPILSGNLCFVCKGDPVSIFAKTAGLEIKTSGEALSDGNIGETIRVKNRSSSRELDAQVTGIGEVEVRM